MIFGSRFGKGVFLLAGLLFLAGCVSINIPSTMPLTETVVGGRGRAKILIVDVSGVIKDRRPSAWRLIERPSLTSRIREELDKAYRDEDVKAVILRINSPGGEVTTTDIIHHEITRFKEKKDVFVVAQLMGVAASGGYYVALAADRIVAHPTTVVGGIGVVAYRINASGLIEKIGITDETVKSGDKKDMGSPLRPVTDEERRILQGIVDGLFSTFLDKVRASRTLSDREVEAVSDGRVYTASQALKLRLIDSIGYMDDTVELVKKQAGLRDARIVTYARPGSYRSNIYSAADLGVPHRINILNIDGSGVVENLGFRFMYLWMP